LVNKYYYYIYQYFRQVNSSYGAKSNFFKENEIDASSGVHKDFNNSHDMAHFDRYRHSFPLPVTHFSSLRSKSSKTKIKFINNY